jgi:hypothetical protein
MFPKITFSIILAGSAVLAGFFLGFPTEFAAADQCSGNGWVKVSPDCPLPDNLRVGDQIEITVGSTVFARRQIIATGKCHGEVRYFTSVPADDCGWRQTVTSYKRSQNAANALSVPQ